jgi:hypothetical protein
MYMVNLLTLKLCAGKFDMKVKRCFSFSNTNNTVRLVDDRG